MTVAELIAELQRRKPDALVLVTWETTVHEIEPEFVYESLEGDVMIDADYGSDRFVFEKEGHRMTFKRGNRYG